MWGIEIRVRGGKCENDKEGLDEKRAKNVGTITIVA